MKPNIIKAKFKSRYHKTTQKALEALKGLDVVIAGGSCLTAAQKTYGQFASEANDIDVFCLDEKTYQQVQKRFSQSKYIDCADYENSRAKDYRTVQEIPSLFNEPSDSFLDYQDTQETLDSIQLIKPKEDPYASFDELIKDFDLLNSQFWTVYPFDDVQTYQNLEVLHEIRTDKDLSYHSLGRIIKYISNKRLSLPEDGPLFDKIVELYTTTNESFYSIPESEYKGTDLKDYREHQRRVLLPFLEYAIAIGHPLDKHLRTLAGRGVLTLLEDIIKRGGYAFEGFNSENFLINYWIVLHFKKGDFGDLGPRLENKEFFEVNKKKTRKIYPELFL